MGSGGWGHAYVIATFECHGPVSGLRICDICEVYLFGLSFGVGEFAVSLEF